jgi:hypothetical protein
MKSLLLAALVFAPAILQSQQTAPATGHAVVTGVAVDSVRGGYLRGAMVTVSGTQRSAVTDSSGRFRIDSVAPGPRHLELIHPLLDSIGLRVRSPERNLVAGDTTVFILAVPAPKTIVATKCTADDLTRGNAALVGIVSDADTEMPSAGATVSVEWVDFSLGRRSMNKLPQKRIGTVRSDGSYRVCGIPADLTTGAIAVRGADSTAAIPINFANQLAVVSFKLPPVATAQSSAPRPDSTTTAGTAVLTGRVLDPAGSPLANARVAIDADQAAAITDNQGAFRLTGLRTGTRPVSVRRLGFASKEVAVDVTNLSPRPVTITMERYVAVLDAVRISAIRDIGLQRVGFSDRQKSASGKFFGPEEISRRNPQRLSMLIEMAPSLRMGTNADGKRYVTGRLNSCVQYYVDGLRWFSTNPTDLEMSPDAFLSGGELGAVEVYDALSAPPIYQGISSRGEPCAVVVIWTKWKLDR